MVLATGILWGVFRPLVVSIIGLLTAFCISTVQDCPRAIELLVEKHELSVEDSVFGMWFY